MKSLGDSTLNLIIREMHGVSPENPRPMAAKMGETALKFNWLYFHVGGEGLPLEHESLEDLGRKADLCIFHHDCVFNHDVVQT